MMSALTSNKTDSRSIFYHKDGLLDLFIGLGIFFAGLLLWTEMVWMAGIFIPVLYPSFQAARKRFLLPRIGGLDHTPQHRVQVQKLLFSVTLLLGGLLLAGIGMFFAFGVLTGPVNDWLRQYFLLVLAVIFASVWIFASVLLRINRFYLYAGFTFGALSVAQFTVLPFWVALAALGGLISLVGSIYLIRFVQQHPVMD